MNVDQYWDEDCENSLSKIPFYEGKKELEERYVYENQIGKGAYGYVLCGHRLKDQCSVAIKVIPSRLVSEWFQSKLLQRKIPLEVLLLVLTREIDGVVSIEEFYEDVQLQEWYIVMEKYMKTMDLFEYINSLEYLQEDIACRILYQLLIIIIDCHLLGVVHRDIKEENILIDPTTTQIWLIDFGSGSLMKDDHHTTYNGTLSYAPPEWLRDGHYRGCQLECWTMGIVLYSMLCGSVPFEDEEQILFEMIRFPRKLSSSCVKLILRCLERDPESRITPFEMLSHPWIIFNRNMIDSGRSSFDDAIIQAPQSRRCSCSCGENIPFLSKEDSSNNMAIIETVGYDTECVKEIDSDWNLKVINASLLPDIDLKQSLYSSKSIDQIRRVSSSKLIDFPRKKISRESGFIEDMDEYSQNEEESLVNSKEDFFNYY